MDGQRDAEARDRQAAAARPEEQERRRRERRERVRARHPWIGWLLLALAGAQAYDEDSRGGADRAGRRRDGEGTPNEPS